MKLKAEIKKTLHEPMNVGVMMTRLNKSYATLRRWFDNDSQEFTKKKVIELICEITGLSEDEIFETETAK